MTTNELATLGVIFVVVWTASFAVVYGLIRRGRDRKKRLPPASDQEESQTELVLGSLTPALAEPFPVSESSQTDLQRDLLAAGFYRKTALTEYLAIRTVLIVLPLLVAGIVGVFIDSAYIWHVVVLGLIGAGLGFSLPRAYITLRGRHRGRQIERGLPIAVDMLTLCLSAGQNILAALQRVATELRMSHPVVAAEFEIIRQQAQLRSLQPALQQFADRVQVPEARNLAMILIQSERLGTDASATLLEYASNLRTSLRQRADAKANRTMFWMLFPTLLCLWIPAGIVLIGPAVLEFQYYRREAIQEWREAREQLQELQPAMPQAPGNQASPTSPGTVPNTGQ